MIAPTVPPIASGTSTLLKPAQAAEQLGVKIATVWAWCRNGRLPHIRLNARNFRLRQSDIDAFLDSRTH